MITPWKNSKFITGFPYQFLNGLFYAEHSSSSITHTVSSFEGENLFN